MFLARILRSVGELLITAGVVVLLFVVYTLYVTDLINAGTQKDLKNTFVAQEQQLTPPVNADDPANNPDLPRPALGTGIAVLRIPRLSSDYDPVIVEGVNTADLQKGPGHYPGSAVAGGDGNFVVSGHRTTYGKPFTDLDKVQVGDSIVVETPTFWYTYRATREFVVQPTAIDVVDALPPDETAGQKLLTFTTCNPKYSASQRLILRGVLVSADAKFGKADDWVPPALEKGAAPDAVKDLPSVPAVGTVVPHNPAAGAGGTGEPSSYDQGASQALNGAV